MKYLFNGNIKDWITWKKTSQSIEPWKPLINFILKKENLPVLEIENLNAGTNVVFRLDKFIIKIFTPKEVGHDDSIDNKSEVFALSFAKSMGVSVPNIIAYGEINDKYNFSYIIMEYIKGVNFNTYSANFSTDEKLLFAKRIREITDLLHKSCNNFNGIDAIYDKNRYIRWENYFDKFKMERLEYLNRRDFGKKVFIHGDLVYSNFIIDNKGGISIIDFADSVIAPQSYEYAYLISVLFNFDKSYLHGYFDEYNIDKLVDLCFDGLLIHKYGGAIITHKKIAEINELKCLEDLREKIYKLIKYN